MRRNPLVWALPLQAALLFARLDLLEPWGDEWFTLTTVPLALSQIRAAVAANIHPPLYFFLLHFWSQIPLSGSPLVKMRAMSAVWTLVATVLLYVLWLRGEEPRLQRVFLGLWVLSPCLLLYGRMARSYSMQLALATIALYAAIRWVERPGNVRRLLGYSAASTALLYTHYLPGLAILAGVCLALLFRREHTLRVRLTAAVGSAALITLLYLPWIATIRSAAGNWVSSSPYQVGNFWTDQAVRIGYWFVSFSFGETMSTVSLILCVVLTPAIAYGLCRGLASRPAWLSVTALVAAIGYIGVSRWTGFPFTPARMLFVLPFFVILAVRELKPLALAGLAVLYILADYSYFSRTGYLNKAYCVPYQEMAAMIRGGSGAGAAVVLMDAYSSFPDPLLGQLDDETKAIVLDGGESEELVRAVIREKPAVIWVWRHTHDTSPGGFVSKLEEEAREGREAREYGFLPYSQPERWALRMLRGPGQPKYFYQLVELR